MIAAASRMRVRGCGVPSVVRCPQNLWASLGMTKPGRCLRCAQARAGVLRIEPLRVSPAARPSSLSRRHARSAGIRPWPALRAPPYARAGTSLWDAPGGPRHQGGGATFCALPGLAALAASPARQPAARDVHALRARSLSLVLATRHPACGGHGLKARPPTHPPAAGGRVGEAKTKPTASRLVGRDRPQDRTQDRMVRVEIVKE